MSTVQKCLEGKPHKLISVSPSDSVSAALTRMRDNRVRSVLVMEDQTLVGIITQGDCAIKVLLQGLDAQTTLVRDVMTRDPITVSLSDTLDKCMNWMAGRNIRHLPAVQGGKVMGVVSIGDVVKYVIEQQGTQIQYLETYIRGHGAA